MEKCHVDNCKEPPVFSCKCDSPFLLICSSHLQAHLLSAKDHSITSLYLQISEDLLPCLTSAKSTLLDLQKSVISNLTLEYRKKIDILNKELNNKLTSLSFIFNSTCEKINIVVSSQSVRHNDELFSDLNSNIEKKLTAFLRKALWNELQIELPLPNASITESQFLYHVKKTLKIAYKV